METIITQAYIDLLTDVLFQNREKKKLSKQHLSETLEYLLKDLKDDKGMIADRDLAALDNTLLQAIETLEIEYISEERIAADITEKAEAVTAALLQTIREDEYYNRVLADSTVTKKILDNDQISLALRFLKYTIQSNDAVRDLRKRIKAAVANRDKPVQAPIQYVNSSYIKGHIDQITQDLIFCIATPTLEGNPSSKATVTTQQHLYILSNGETYKDPKTGQIQIKKAHLTPTTKIVLNILVAKLYTQIPHSKNLPDTDRGKVDRKRTVEISVQEYADLRDISLQAARKQLETAYNELTKVSLKGIKNGVPTNTERQLFSEIEEMTDQKTKKGSQRKYKSPTYKFRFEQDYATTLARGNTTLYCVNLLKIKTKHNPYSFVMGQKIILHHNLNIAKANSNALTIKSFVNSLPEIPRAEETRETKARIKEPLIRDLQALIDYGVLSEIRYREGAKKDDALYLTPAQVTDLSYDNFLAITVEFTLVDYPEEVVKRIAEQKQQKKQEAAERRKRNKQHKEDLEANKRAEREAKEKAEQENKGDDQTTEK